MSRGESADDVFGVCRERIERGEAVDPDEVIRAHPDIAEELREQFAAMRLVDGAFGASESAATADADSVAGRSVGAYRLLREIGRGGQAAVWLAEDTRLPRKAALKLFPPGLVPSPKFVARFRREAEAASRLDHPDICTVFDAGVDGDTPYIAMRHVEGRTLAEWIEASRDRAGAAGGTSSVELPCAPGAASSELTSSVLRVVALIERVARALHFAHEAGLVHRDVKPGNVMVTKDGAPVLLDFGLAREDDGETLTMTGSLVGTPAYMSPEQLLGQHLKIDRRTDVYSLGVTLYECLTLRRPFDAPTREALYQKILSSSAEAPRRANPLVPRDLEVVVQTAMEKDRGRRYRTALDFADDLARIRRREPILARPTPALVRLGRWAQRHPGVATGVASAFVLLAAGLGATTWFLDQSREEQKRTAAALTHARAMALSNASAAEIATDPMRALLLAREAVRVEESPATVNRLRSALFQSLGRRILRGHAGDVRAAAFSPQGDRVVTTSYDKTARVWDLAGRELAVLRGHEGNVIGASFSPRGDRIVTASEDGTARVWDPSGTEVAVLRGHAGALSCAAFSPEGDRIVTASTDGTARLWSVSGAELAVLRGHTKRVGRATFSPLGDRVVTASDDSTARVWDSSGRELAVLAGHTAGLYVAVFSPQGDRILTASTDSTARVWDLSGATLAVLSGHTARVDGAAFSPSGDRIVTASWDATARLWSVSGERLAVLHGHEASVRSATFSPNGDRIVTTSEDDTARVWDASGKALDVLAGHGQTVWTANFSPDGHSVVTASVDATARIWSVYGGEAAVLRGHGGTVTCAAFLPDGDRIVTAASDRTARVWNLDGAELAEMKGHDDTLWWVAASPRGDRIVTASRDGTARLWDLTGAEVATLRGHRKDVCTAAFSPAGDRIVTASLDDTARVWDLSGREIMSLPGSIRSASFSPLGDSILTASSDKSARIWDLTGRELVAMKGHEHWLFSAAFSARADRVVSASLDTTARVWDVRGRELAVLRGHAQDVKTAVFSPGGDRVLTASSDRTARIWDAAGGEVAILRGHGSRLRSAAFSPRGDRIVTASDDGTARVWLVRTADLLRLADERILRDFTADERKRYADLLGGD